MTAAVTIVDYGSGNIFSVTRAFEHCGARVALSDSPGVVERAERLVLPGVGAFADGMRSLRDLGLDEAIRRFSSSGRPLFAICLGMQMLATTSEEFGESSGLNLVAGRVVPIPSVDIKGNPHKIPHIGWADVEPSAPGRWRGTIFDDVIVGTPFYLVHSFHLIPDDSTSRLADCFYGGHRITAAVQAGGVFGCQFHPEKSGSAGLRLLTAFLRL